MATDDLDWTTRGGDPNDPVLREAVRRTLLQRRVVDTSRGLPEFLTERVRGRRVLDVGVCDHCREQMDRAGWRHGLVREAAAYCLGIDVLPELIDVLARAGYHVRTVDATSDVDLEERFDVVFMGDVIEHVDSPVRLLRFGKRHLSPGGTILVTTPNPFSRKFYRRFRRDGTAVVNLDHVAWVTPSMALELGRRAGLRLVHYHLIKPGPRGAVARWLKGVLRALGPVEFAFPDYLYEFSSPPP